MRARAAALRVKVRRVWWCCACQPRRRSSSTLLASTRDLDASEFAAKLQQHPVDVHLVHDRTPRASGHHGYKRHFHVIQVIPPVVPPVMLRYDEIALIIIWSVGTCSLLRVFE
jgi:hypothetical protein